MRVLIGVPSYGAVEPECVESLMNLDRRGHDVGFLIQRGYLIDAERNAIARAAIDGGYDFCLMVDSDVVLPPGALACLLDPPADVVLGVYREKRYMDDGRYLNVHRHMPMDYVIESCMEAGELDCPQSRVTVKGGGAGCLMIRTAALAEMPEPWFEFVDYGNGQCLSEDLYFCENARASGLTVWADTRVRCGHVVRRIEWP